MSTSAMSGAMLDGQGHRLPPVGGLADHLDVVFRLLNTGRQVGGSIGLAVLGTVAWTVVANTAHGAATARTAVRAAAYQHALAAGFGRAFLVAAGIALLALIVAVTMIRVRRADLDAS
jgi:hypothetical protein